MFGIWVLLSLSMLFSFNSCAQKTEQKLQLNEDDNIEKIVLTESEWKKSLSPEKYKILREKGTERAFSGKYNKVDTEGVFICGACRHPVFHTAQKFDSGSGWPSFWKPLNDSAIQEVEDRSLGMNRIEIICKRCDSHLGHVFNDGPRPTGLRYCINSLALDFIPANSGQ